MSGTRDPKVKPWYARHLKRGWYGWVYTNTDGSWFMLLTDGRKQRVRPGDVEKVERA